MKSYLIVALAAAAAQVNAGSTSMQELCQDSTTNENGNYFCKMVDQITYAGVDSAGSYQDVISMNEETGECGWATYEYSGPLSPLNEGVSVHLRGPFQLAQFAVYMPGSSSQKRSIPDPTRTRKRKNEAHARRELQKRQAANGQALAKRADAVWVTATINGDVVSWLQTPTPVADSGVVAAAAAEAQPTTTQWVYKSVRPDETEEEEDTDETEGTTTTTQATNDDDTTSSDVGSYGRSAYYNAAAQEADGVTFLAYHGGDGACTSGSKNDWFDASLSYVTSDGLRCSDSPTILEDTTIPSQTEVTIMSDKPCTDDTCGFVRDNAPAYQGFIGADKVFLFEFKMPMDGTSGGGMNMPALWTLNAKIPQTQPYGNAKRECSCWYTQCGEFDLFEVLAPGDTKAKSTLHPMGGDSNYFNRPTDEYIKLATIWDSASSSLSVKIIPSDTDFGTGLDRATIETWLEGDSDPKLASMFTVASS